LKHVLTSR